jgi:hypothetical protein
LTTKTEKRRYQALIQTRDMIWPILAGCGAGVGSWIFLNSMIEEAIRMDNPGIISFDTFFVRWILPLLVGVGVYWLVCLFIAGFVRCASQIR